jgi:DNA topoisomerase-1
VAKRLGNTPAICRKCYVHPVILESYLERSLVETVELRAEKQMTGSPGELRPEEAAVLEFLKKRIAKQHNGNHHRKGNSGSGSELR